MAIQAADVKVKFGSEGSTKVQKDLKDAGGAVESLQERFDSCGTSTRKWGGILTAGLTAPFVAGFEAAVFGASDLEEALNKVNVIFEDVTKVVTDWADENAHAFSLTKRETLDFTSSFPQLLDGVAGSNK